MERVQYGAVRASEQVQPVENRSVITPDILAMLDQLRGFESAAKDEWRGVETWVQSPLDIFEEEVEKLLIYPDDVFEWFASGRQDLALPEVKQRWQELLRTRLTNQLPAIIAQLESGVPLNITFEKLFDIFNPTFLFQSICRILLKERGGELLDIESLRVRELPADQLSVEQKAEMTAIVSENYRQLSGLADDFRRQLESGTPDATVYHLLDRRVNRDLSAEVPQIDHEVIGFVRVGQQERGFYISGFHMQPELQASGIGVLLIESVISQYQKEGDLYALAEAGSPALNFYLNVLGAQEVRRIENTDPTRSGGVEVEIMLPQKRA